MYLVCMTIYTIDMCDSIYDRRYDCIEYILWD